MKTENEFTLTGHLEDRLRRIWKSSAHPQARVCQRSRQRAAAKERWRRKARRQKNHRRHQWKRLFSPLTSRRQEERLLPPRKPFLRRSRFIWRNTWHLQSKSHSTPTPRKNYISQKSVRFLLEFSTYCSCFILKFKLSFTRFMSQRSYLQSTKETKRVKSKCLVIGKIRLHSLL